MVIAPAMRLISPELMVTISVSSIPRVPEVGVNATLVIAGRFASMAGVLVAMGEVVKLLLTFPALSRSTILTGMVADWAMSVSPETTPYFARYDPLPKSVKVDVMVRPLIAMAEPVYSASSAVIFTVRVSAIFSVPVVGVKVAVSTTGELASIPGELAASGEVVYSALVFPEVSSNWTLTGMVAASEISSSPSVIV